MRSRPGKRLTQSACGRSLLNNFFQSLFKFLDVIQRGRGLQGADSGVCPGPASHLLTPSNFVSTFSALSTVLGIGGIVLNVMV